MVGVAADLETGSLCFATNGEWAEVFRGAANCGEMAAGLFPSITTDGGSYAVNFGASPFQFPGPKSSGCDAEEGEAAYVPVAPSARALRRYRGVCEDVEGDLEEGQGGEG